MSVTYLLLVHQEPLALARLVARLQAPGHAFVVHVDGRVSLDPFVAALAGQANVFFLDDALRLRCHWAGWSLAAAMLALLENAQRMAPADWYVFLSGADYPLQAPLRIEAALRGVGARIAVWREVTTDARTPWRLRQRVFGLNCNEVAWLNRRELALAPRWKRWPLTLLSLAIKAGLYVLPLRRCPPGWRIFRGSQWLALSASQARAALALLETGDGKKIRALLAHSAAPDELLFATLLHKLASSDGVVTVAQAGVRHGTHWIDWRNAREPAPLDSDAVRAALASDALFCRKLPPLSSAAGVRLRVQIDAALDAASGRGAAQ